MIFLYFFGIMDRAAEAVIHVAHLDAPRRGQLPAVDLLDIDLRGLHLAVSEKSHDLDDRRVVRRHRDRDGLPNAVLRSSRLLHLRPGILDAQAGFDDPIPDFIAHRGRQCERAAVFVDEEGVSRAQIVMRQFGSEKILDGHRHKLRPALLLLVCHIFAALIGLEVVRAQPVHVTYSSRGGIGNPHHIAYATGILLGLKPAVHATQAPAAQAGGMSNPEMDTMNRILLALCAAFPGRSVFWRQNAGILPQPGDLARFAP
ncbi:hypothetical protein IT41_07835 [Paracoccus halophilus]|uniref:Uncharacterized protein n=1 Tax=Paracoccus halophilus TaxID=376733 RepID=A0A099F3F5_9RHOB|nr:hypothetical protein IT41_07835 [Paracoccus halophilus]